MADNDDYDDDFFADVYAEEQTPKKEPVPTPQVEVKPEIKNDPTPQHDAPAQTAINSYDGGQASGYGDYAYENGGSGQPDQYEGHEEEDDGYGGVGIKEDGKMFIGGLNWETTDESLRDYFSQFGEVTECTVMRDGASGRSRGFGFLTFKDPKCVNTVMVKEHFLDGKIIDPKRAIPREEQERTAKIFVGGVSPEASELDFKNFFTQFGRVIDATLMIDKDTGRPRGFGFVTFDGDEAVDRALSGPLQIYGKPMEVKRAQPRSTLAQQQEDKKFGGGRGGGGFGRQNENQGYDNMGGGGGMQGGQMGGGPGQGISPAMMAKYWYNMQQYFKSMQSAIQQPMAMPNPMAGMNPAMMAQMMGQMGGASGSAGPQGMQGGLSPNMMAQMGQQQQTSQSGDDEQGQQQYEGDQQQPNRQNVQRGQQQQQNYQQSYNQGGPTSWDGMYDDIPQPNGPPQGPQRGGYRGGNFHRGGGNRYSNTPPVQPNPNAPVNAPTGPKNAGKPGANYYRGGGRGGRGGYHPYAR